MGYFSTAGPMPANLSFGRDLTIRRKIENGRYYCAFGRSKASNQGTTSRSTRALLKAIEAAVYKAVYDRGSESACR
jgi:hypothetical protein